MLRPLNRQILIDLDKQEVTKSGIIIAAAGDNLALEQAKVIALDPSIETVKEGDTVFFKLYALSTIKIEGKDYSFINESDLLAVQ